MPKRDLALLEKARRALLNGTIPDRRPDQVRGVPSSGMICSVCNLAIKDETDVQCYFKEQAGSVIHHLHVRCVVAWELERWKGESQQLGLDFRDGSQPRSLSR